MNFHRCFVISGLLLLTPFSSAFAQDAATVGERLKSGLAKQGTILTFDRISGDAAQMIIEGAAISVISLPEAIKLGTIALAGIEEDSGNLLISSMTMENYSAADEEMTMDISGIGISNLRIPAEGTDDTLAGLLMYDAAEVKNVSIKRGGRQIMAMDDLRFDIGAPIDGKPMTFTGTTNKLSADLSVVESPEYRKFIETLGLQTLTGAFRMEGYWQPEDGRLAMQQFDLSADKVGTLGMTYDLGGYTLDFIKNMQKLQEAQASTSQGSDTSAHETAVLGLIQQLTLHSTSIRFDDDSLTGKVITYLADQQHVKPEAVINQAKGLLPFILASLNTPDLAAQTIEAVNSYLDDPKSLEISVRPEKPTPFSVITASAMSQSPNDVARMLGASVKANQPPSAE